MSYRECLYSSLRAQLLAAATSFTNKRPCTYACQRVVTAIRRRSHRACAAVIQAEAAATQSLATAGSYGPGSMQRQMSLGLAGRRMSLSSRSAPPNMQPSSPPGMGSSGNLADAQQAEHNGAQLPPRQHIYIAT